MSLAMDVRCATYSVKFTLYAIKIQINYTAQAKDTRTYYSIHAGYLYRWRGVYFSFPVLVLGIIQPPVRSVFVPFSQGKICGV